MATQRLEELENRITAINRKLEVLLNYLTKNQEKESDTFSYDPSVVQFSMDGSRLKGA